MDHAIEVLRHAESVLVKKLKGMKDGKPKWAAAHKIEELRNAISLIEQYENVEVDDDMLTGIFIQNPPKAKA